MTKRYNDPERKGKIIRNTKAIHGKKRKEDNYFKVIENV